MVSLDDAGVGQQEMWFGAHEIEMGKVLILDLVEEHAKR